MTATLHTTNEFEGHRANARSTEPNYALRRTVVGVIAALVVLLVAVSSATAVGALTGLGGRPAAASEAALVSGSELVTRAVHVAEPGDSLWSIAQLYRGGASRQRYVDSLIDLNGGTAIQAGQAVRLP